MEMEIKFEFDTELLSGGKKLTTTTTTYIHQ
jgi:hypothetical protein